MVLKASLVISHEPYKDVQENLHGWLSVHLTERCHMTGCSILNSGSIFVLMIVISIFIIIISIIIILF